jgi:hypothetical protein
MRVEYEAEQGERGLKVATVRIVDASTSRANDVRPLNGDVRPLNGEARPLNGEARPLNGEARPLNGETPAKAAPVADDDCMCDVLGLHEFTTEVTEVLLQQVPSLTGAQIAQIRECFIEFARSHGWVEI